MSNTLKQFVGNPSNSFVVDHFVRLALKGLIKKGTKSCTVLNIFKSVSNEGLPEFQTHKW